MPSARIEIAPDMSEWSIGTDNGDPGMTIRFDENGGDFRLIVEIGEKIQDIVYVNSSDPSDPDILQLDYLNLANQHAHDYLARFMGPDDPVVIISADGEDHILLNQL